MNNLKMHIALLLGVVFLSSGGVLATSVDGYDPDGKLDVSLACASCGNQSLYYVAELQAAIKAVIKQAREEREAAAARTEAEKKAAAAIARAPRAAARVFASGGEGYPAPTITSRQDGLIRLGDKNPIVFADDPLLITPFQEGWKGQYRITRYTGIAKPTPTNEWQDAKIEEWLREFQFAFTLPRGKMFVEVRAINESTHEASSPSEPVEFLVKGGGS